jgi:hypothetical protein
MLGFASHKLSTFQHFSSTHCSMGSQPHCITTERREDTLVQVMVALASIERIQAAEVMLVDSIITEFYSINTIQATSERYHPS